MSAKNEKATDETLEILRGCLIDWICPIGPVGLELKEEMQMNETKSLRAEQIEQRAYELYLQRGGEDGHDLADWLVAEKELTELPEQANSGAPKVRAAAVGRVAQATP